jgi:hypothetical protein
MFSKHTFLNRNFLRNALFETVDSNGLLRMEDSKENQNWVKKDKMILIN